MSSLVSERNPLESMAFDLCLLCHKPTAAGLRSVIHPESTSNAEQRRFFVNFVSQGYQWPVGRDGPSLYMCRRSCQAKIQQGVAKAADLKKIVNELRVQHIAQLTSSQVDIHVKPEDPPCETPSSLISGMDDSDDINLQTHRSQLGKRKVHVPYEVRFTPEISKIPKIVTDTQEGMSRRRLSYGTPPAGTTATGATPTSVIKVEMEVDILSLVLAN